MEDRERDELGSVERVLRTERPRLGGPDLERIERGVLRNAARQGGRGMTLRSRLVMALLVVGLMATGGGAVIAASGGSSSKGSSANSQYCPPSSPGAGKPKGGEGGNKCGQCPDDGSSDKKKCQCDDSNEAGDNGKGKD